MSDHIELKPGVLPWEPPSVEHPIQVLRRFGMPLAGILHQFGNSYFFCCVAGEAARASLWVYLLVTSEQIERIREWGGRPSAVEALISEDSPYVIALYEEEHGITRAEPVPVPSEYESPLDAAIHVLELDDEKLELLETAYA